MSNRTQNLPSAECLISDVPPAADDLHSPAVQHPSWCDPRACVVDEGVVDHRQPTVSWTAQNHRFTVGLSRLDVPGEDVGDEQAMLVIEHLDSLTEHGDVISVEVHLPAADAQKLAVALGGTMAHQAAIAAATR